MGVLCYYPPVVLATCKRFRTAAKPIGKRSICTHIGLFRWCFSGIIERMLFNVDTTFPCRPFPNPFPAFPGKVGCERTWNAMILFAEER